jgi:catalase
MTLNEIPANYFADVEQAAFAPAHVVDGVGYSPDKMLQGRLLSYPDAHRYRLGVNYEQLPVNRCPFAVANYQRDGFMRVDGNGGSSPNYWPNSFDDVAIDGSYKEPPMALESTLADWYERNAPGEDDHYTQPGNLFRRVMSDDDRRHLVHNIVASMQGVSGLKRDEIIIRQLCHFFRADVSLGMGVAQGLGVDVGQWLPQGHVPA